MTKDTATLTRLEKSKRHYNAWVVNETLKDYSLQYAPRSFRRWSEFTVANTALGGISDLANFAIGGSIAISLGFTNSFWAIMISAVIIFVVGVPIADYAARYNIDNI
jgi:cytosine/uracil/thiamine/allantoin permease